MSEENPSKAEIQAVFKKLRLQNANKMCFDCNANNPTWASVTYGVFICIDCSAVHRGLGVHLSFVRSTNLDVNWTWLQIRAMQLGGNANATQFFRQHGCTTTDSQQKYKSRAAQLYRDKLHHICAQAMRVHGNKVHIDAPMSPDPTDSKEIDFFEESHHSAWGDIGKTIRPNQSNQKLSDEASLKPKSHENGDVKNEREPIVEHINTSIDVNNKPMKKANFVGKKINKNKMGANKFGAAKVTTNFDEIEAKAETAEKEREMTASLRMKVETDQIEEDLKGLSQRLMMQDIADERNKNEKKLSGIDPKKAAQSERLGMAFGSASRGNAHSVASGIVEIQQEGSRTRNLKLMPEREPFYPKALSSNNDEETFYDTTDDNWTVLSSEPKASSRLDAPDDTTPKMAAIDSSGDFFDNWKSDEPQKSSKKPLTQKLKEKPAPTVYSSTGSAAEQEASVKFGNAKAISSDMFFNKTEEIDSNTKSTLNRFEGATSISSSDFYGGGPGSGVQAPVTYNYGNHVPDVQDIKDSVRQGVTKVAGKLSNLSSSISSYYQDGYY